MGQPLAQARGTVLNRNQLKASADIYIESALPSGFGLKPFEDA
jgi:hypothetical protein